MGGSKRETTTLSDSIFLHLLCWSISLSPSPCLSSRIMIFKRKRQTQLAYYDRNAKTTLSMILTNTCFFFLSFFHSKNIHKMCTTITNIRLLLCLADVRYIDPSSSNARALLWTYYYLFLGLCLAPQHHQTNIHLFGCFASTAFTSHRLLCARLLVVVVLCSLSLYWRPLLLRVDAVVCTAAALDCLSVLAGVCPPILPFRWEVAAAVEVPTTTIGRTRTIRIITAIGAWAAIPVSAVLDRSTDRATTRSSNSSRRAWATRGPTKTAAVATT